jgi:hypothetical protein
MPISTVSPANPGFGTPSPNRFYIPPAFPDVSETLYGSASWSWSASADLTIGKVLASSASWAWSGNADETVGKPLSVAASWAWSASVDLTLGKPLASSGSWTWTGAADATLGKPVASSASWLWSGTADLTVTSSSGDALAALGAWTLSANAGLTLGKPIAAVASWHFDAAIIEASLTPSVRTTIVILYNRVGLPPKAITITIIPGTVIQVPARAQSAVATRSSSFVTGSRLTAVSAAGRSVTAGDDHLPVQVSGTRVVKVIGR